MTLHLSLLLFAPLAFGVAGMLVAPALASRVALLGSLLTAAYAIAFLVDFDSSSGILQHVTDDTWIAELGIHYKLGLDGLNLFLVVLTAILWLACTLWAMGRNYDKPRLFFFHLALAETAVLGAARGACRRRSSSSSTRSSARCSC
jgi:NADH-quinone oxidoreductase subunit M